MTIGGSIFLLALGLILALAVDVAPTPAAGISIQWDMIGWILVLAGLLGLLLSWNFTRRRTMTSSDPTIERRTTIVEDDLLPPR
jgi:membrane protein implicated in regulation of membrane protease activity